MDIYLYLSGNRVTGTSESEAPDTVKVTIPTNHEVRKNPRVFTYANGTLTKDTTYQSEKVKAEQKNLPSLQEQVDSLKRQNSDLAYMLMLKGVL
jgi:hypothetical protein